MQVIFTTLGQLKADQKVFLCVVLVNLIWLHYRHVWWFSGCGIQSWDKSIQQPLAARILLSPATGFHSLSCVRVRHLEIHVLRKHEGLKFTLKLSHNI